MFGAECRWLIAMECKLVDDCCRCLNDKGELSSRAGMRAPVVGFPQQSADTFPGNPDANLPFPYNCILRL